MTVLPGADLEGAWERFAPFEALHHRLDICNPISPRDLQEVVEALQPVDGDRVLDVACGHGELLMRLAARAAIDGVGVDLSPWAISRAARRAARRGLQERVAWWLGDGAGLPADPAWTIVSCLGASWIWDGFAGTAAALAARVMPGGRVALGDGRARSSAAQEALAELGLSSAATPTETEQLAVLERSGLTPLAHVDPGPHALGAYYQRVLASTTAWARSHPEDDYRHQASAAVERFRFEEPHLEWTVWIAERHNVPIR